MVRKGNLPNLKVVISLKPERPCPQKLVYMHTTSTSTYMNFLSQFYLIQIFDYTVPLTVVHGPKGKFAKFESSNISETGESMPTKIGIHAHYINFYLHEFFEPILFDSNF